MSNLSKKYHKKDIAAAQLKTAVEMLLKNKYLSAAITLSSAAGTILSQIARNADEESFIDYARRIYTHITKGQTPSREKYNHHIDKTLGVPPHKHMSNSDPETIELDILKCAEDGITRAVADYVALYGQEETFIKKFLQWKWHCRDGKKLMAELKDIPMKLILKKKKHVKKTYKRFDLAAEQLEAAIVLFCSGGDKFSVTTLAGAADVIFSQLVTRKNKDNFAQILMKKENDQRTLQEAGKEINDILGINAIKHFDDDGDEHVTIDIQECAFAAILKALVNYNMLDGKDENLILGFRAWAQANLDLKKYNIPT